MSDNNDIGTPQAQQPQLPCLEQLMDPVAYGWKTFVLPKLMRMAFVLVRMGVVALVTWAATHKITWISGLLGTNVDAIAAAIIGAISVAFHEADIFFHAHPEALPAWARKIWDTFHAVNAAPAPASTLPTVADIRTPDKTGAAFYSMPLAVVAAALLATAVLAGCSTLAPVEHQILVDGHAVGKLLVQDGHQVIQLAIDDLNAYRTNDAFRASVDKDIAAAAIIAAKIP